MKLFTKNVSTVLTDLISLIIILLYTVTVVICCEPQNRDHDGSVTEFGTDWVCVSDGKGYDIEILPKGDITLTHSLSGTDTSGRRLCFKSVDTHITASFDGTETYSYAPEQANILGSSYGMYIHMIQIPDGAQEVTLSLHPVYSGKSAEISAAAIQDQAEFVRNIYREGLPNLALCGLITLFGVLMLIMGVTASQTPGSSTVNFFALGAFAILIGIWSANDTYIVQVFTQRPEIMRFVNYLCLIFIAYLPVSFMASATNHRNTPLLPVLFTLTSANFVITMTLSLLGKSDVRRMLLFSHINIAIAMCMTVYLMVRAARRKTINPQFLHTIIIGMSTAVFGVGVDMVRFRLFPEGLLGSSVFTRVGVLVFIIMVGMHLMRERTRLAVEQGRAELMEKLAYTDGLTELANRAAFHEKENEIRRYHTECTIVQLDINFLKKVNDVYGHAEGDRHIINAARIIRDSFEEIGTSYRVGGDEFIVVAQHGGIPEVEEALLELERLVEEYNESEKPPVPLQIAYGYAHYATQADMLETAEQLADQRMYEKKRAMKEMED